MTQRRHNILRSSLPQRRGLTLVELVTSMTIMTILLGAMTSAVLMSSHALPDGRSPSHRLVQAGDVLDRMAGELFYATSTTKTAANGVAFTVDDRNHGDPGPETISYDWSGTPGDPLTRQYNGGTAVTIAEDVQEFDLTYSVVTQQISAGGGPVESNEVLFTQERTQVSPLYVYKVTQTAWKGQYFDPANFNVTPLPGNTTSWKITTVELVLRQYGAVDGQFALQVRDADGDGLPISAHHGEQAVSESDLAPSFDWHTTTFETPIAGLSPTQDLCLVLKYLAGSDAVLEYDESTAPTGRLKSTDAGATWIKANTRRFRYKIYGTYETPSAGPVEATRSVITGVDVQLRVGPHASTRVETSVQTLNTPEASGP